jgi:hypothetical protein
VTRTRVAAVLLVSALAAPACFDVHTVQPPIFVIDDFDDGDLQPSAANFGPWICYVFHADPNDGSGCTRDLDEGDQSPFSLSLSFTVNDPVDGAQQDGGGGLATYASQPEDLTRFLGINFHVKLDSGTPPLPVDTVVDVEIGCQTASPESGSSMLHNLYVLQSGRYNDAWQTIDLALADFVLPSDPTMAINGGTPACLRLADGVRFAVHPGLRDGDSAQGFLHVDDIYFN